MEHKPPPARCESDTRADVTSARSVRKTNGLRGICWIRSQADAVGDYLSKDNSVVTLTYHKAKQDLVKQAHHEYRKPRDRRVPGVLIFLMSFSEWGCPETAALRLRLPERVAKEPFSTVPRCPGPPFRDLAADPVEDEKHQCAQHRDSKDANGPDRDRVERSVLEPVSAARACICFATNVGTATRACDEVGTIAHFLAPRKPGDESSTAPKSTPSEKTQAQPETRSK